MDRTVYTISAGTFTQEPPEEKKKKIACESREPPCCNTGLEREALGDVLLWILGGRRSVCRRPSRATKKTT